MLSFQSCFAQKTKEPAIHKKNSATILFDAFAKDSALGKGWGYSTLIEYNGKRILFDAGSNADLFKSNVQKLNIDLRTIDFVVVSHAHYDHLNGIDYLLSIHPKVKIYFPYDNFWGATSLFNATGMDSLVRDSLPPELRYFNGKATRFPVEQSGGRFWNANIEFVKASKEIMPGVRLVASGAASMGYFFRPPGEAYHKEFDDCSKLGFAKLPELSLSLGTPAGDVVFVGCSHSGVEQIAAQTLKESGKPISMLLGGFHLLPYNRQQTNDVVQQLKQMGIRKIAPGHCTGHLAFKMLKDDYGKDFIYAGLGTVIEF